MSCLGTCLRLHRTFDYFSVWAQGQDNLNMRCNNFAYMYRNLSRTELLMNKYSFTETLLCSKVWCPKFVTGLNVLNRHISKSIVFLSKSFSNWRISLAKGQLDLSYTFWTMPIPVANEQGFPPQIQRAALTTVIVVLLQDIRTDAPAKPLNETL